MSDRSDKSAASVEAASTGLLSDRSSASVRQPRLNLPSSATAAAARRLAGVAAAGIAEIRRSL